MIRLPNIIASTFRSSRCSYSFSGTSQFISRFSGCLQTSSPGFLSMISSRSITAYNRSFDMVKQFKASVDSTEWQTVYRFPLIVHARVFSRSKLYLTLITLISAPNAIVLYSLDALPYREMVGILCVTGFSTALLYAFGHLFRRLIGSVYLSSDEELVKISHLTFFGNRQDRILNIADVAPLADYNENLNDIFLRVNPTFLSKDTLQESLYISLRFGGILDREKFAHIFGHV